MLYRFQGQKRVLVIVLDSSTSLSLSGALSVCSLLSLPVSLHYSLVYIYSAAKLYTVMYNNDTSLVIASSCVKILFCL